MKWTPPAIVYTVAGMLTVIGVIMHIAQVFYSRDAKQEAMQIEINVLREILAKVEVNTGKIELIIERQNLNTRAIERLNNVVSPPTP